MWNKLLVAFVLSLFSISSLAAHVTCYDSGKVIYDQDVRARELDLFEGFYTFVETKSKKLILTNAICIVDLIMPRVPKHPKVHKSHSVAARSK